ncbi:large ribosomal subunit protein uL1m [Neosynchiropus ocellatus]
MTDWHWFGEGAQSTPNELVNKEAQQLSETSFQQNTFHTDSIQEPPEWARSDIWWSAGDWTLQSADGQVRSGGTIVLVSVATRTSFVANMAAHARTAWRVLELGPRQLLSPGPSLWPLRNQQVRGLSAPRFKQKEEEKAVKKEKRVIDDAGRHKPYGRTAWTPVDDVYVKRFYPRTVHSAAAAIDLLKSYQRLDFTPAHQPLYVDLKLDMKLEKKKTVDAFVSTVSLPHPFSSEANRVVVFTEDPAQVEVALQNGAAFAGGADLIQQVLDDEVAADFFVAVPDMLSKLAPLKNKLRKKFPKSSRGSVGVNVPKMVRLFRTGHEYVVEDGGFVRTQIAMLDLPRDHILENLQMVLTDVASHRPAHFGPFVQRAVMASRTSEALWFDCQELLPEAAQQ